MWNFNLRFYGEMNELMQFEGLSFHSLGGVIKTDIGGWAGYPYWDIRAAAVSGSHNHSTVLPILKTRQTDGGKVRWTDIHTNHP